MTNIIPSIMASPMVNPRPKGADGTRVGQGGCQSLCRTGWAHKPLERWLFFEGLQRLCKSMFYGYVYVT